MHPHSFIIQPPGLLHHRYSYGEVWESSVRMRTKGAGKSAPRSDDANAEMPAEALHGRSSKQPNSHLHYSRSRSNEEMASVRAQPWVALEADNLTSLAELTEANLLKAIEERYRAGLIYTAVGDILVAVNPFQELLMYDGAWSGAYAATDVGGLAPHIYRVASAAYNSMVQGKKNQVCVISGESGAGKTESAKFIMKQVSHS